jgi:SAM-dependent methyltransferase
MDASEYYRNEAQSHGITGLDLETSIAYFRRYVDFASRYFLESGRVLDLGCGSGYSSWMLAQKGLEVYGGDLHSQFFESGLNDRRLQFLSCDVERLPFPDSSLDGVGAHQFLEHVSNPKAALSECLRVLKPGGRLVIVGPNLLSIGLASVSAARQTAKAIRKGCRWKRRTPDMPRHPFGNTLPETWLSLAVCSARSIRKLSSERHVNYLMREPDLRPPGYADNDASYLCNPMDLRTWAKRQSLRVLANGAPHWPFRSVLWPVLGGTWIAIEKPARSTARARSSRPIVTHV